MYFASVTRANENNEMKFRYTLRSALAAISVAALLLIVGHQQHQVQQLQVELKQLRSEHEQLTKAHRALTSVVLEPPVRIRPLAMR